MESNQRGKAYEELKKKQAKEQQAREEKQSKKVENQLSMSSANMATISKSYVQAPD